MCDNRQGLTLFHCVFVSVSVRVHVLCVHASLPLWVSVSVCVYHLLVCRFSLSGRTLPRAFPHVPPRAVEMKRRTGRTTPPPRPLPPTLSTQVSDRPGVCTESDVLVGNTRSELMSVSFSSKDLNYTRSRAQSPTNTSSRTPWLTAAWPAGSTRARRIKYLMYVLHFRFSLALFIFKSF